ncbi:MAG: dTDP-4-dehydrorhamnose reductase [Planctomycetia bacterium]|nr:dTDP-4-dehydrorhamnose reductase [Planctomycetia bacterium]
MKKYLVFGKGGQLGSEWCRQLGEAAVGVDLPEGDITDRYKIEDLMAAIKPDGVINAAAFTAVDAAEKQPALCRKVNAYGPLYLAQACEKAGIPLVHYSTDYVFCGTPLRRPLRETDAVAPQGEYARSKYEGEQNARKCPKHLVLRTCGLYGTPGPNTPGNFVETMRKLGLSRRNLRVVNDQHCTPTWIGSLVGATRFLMEKETWGLYHLTNQGETTWFDFAAEIFRLEKLDVSMEPISTAEWNAPAPRPLYSVLDTQKYHSLGGPPMLTWQDALQKYLTLCKQVS